MRSDLTINYIILGVVGTLALAWLIYNMVIAGRIHEARKRKRGRMRASGSVEKDDTLQRSQTLTEGSSSKPYRDETLYNILKNSHLSSQNSPINLNYLFDETLNYLKIQYRVPGLVVLFNIDADVPVALVGNPGLISQIFINIFEHAVVASKIGTIHLDVSVLSRTEDEIDIQFKITDSDKRTSQAELEAKFADPQSSNAAKLSLHVAKMLVQALDGQMLVSAMPGRGSEVMFDLRFGLPPEKDRFRYPKPSAQAAGVKTLIVDRNPDASIILRKLLANYMPNVFVMQASDFEEHSSDIKRDFGLIIIDQKFLDQQKIAFLRKIPSVRLVASEGLFDEPQHQLAVDYRLSKPFTLERILEMLVIFYGAVPEEKVRHDVFAVQESVPEAKEQRFLSDAEIEPTPNIRADNFGVFAGAKVMIVEDNMINQKVMRGLLGKSGMEIVMADNGVDALKKLPNVMPLDLILMDINMPEMDGLETTRRIRADRRFEALPIVAFTGLNLPNEIAKMEEAGMNAQMAKPLNAGKFYTIFSLFLKARRA